MRLRLSPARQCGATLVACSVLVLIPQAPAAAGTFVRIGLPGDVPFARGISADGSTVVGSHTLAGREVPFRWTAGAGIAPLGVNTGVAFATNRDGATSIGFTQPDVPPNYTRAFRHHAGVGFEDLQTLAGGRYAEAHDVSADGSVVVGLSDAAGPGGSTLARAFRWSAGGGMTSLGTLSGFFESEATGVSGDGLVVVGAATNAVASTAFRWTEAMGMQPLTAAGWTDTFATGVASDGAAVVGAGTTASGLEAFRWTASDGFTALGDLPGGEFQSIALDASADGRVVVGASRRSALGDEAFIWDAGAGMQPLHDVLAATGLEVAGWRLISAEGVSDDGLHITGYGVSPDGHLASFLAILPEPAGVATTLLFSGAVAVAHKPGRRRAPSSR